MLTFNLFSIETAAVAAVIAAAALLGWTAHVRGQVHRTWARRRGRAESLAALHADWWVPVSAALGCL